MQGADFYHEFSRPFYFQYDDYNLLKNGNFDYYHAVAKEKHDQWFKSSYNPNRERTIHAAIIVTAVGLASLTAAALMGSVAGAARLAGYSLSRLTFVAMTALKVGALLVVIACIVRTVAHYLNPHYTTKKNEKTAEFLFLDAVKKGCFVDAHNYFKVLPQVSQNVLSDVFGLMTLNQKMMAIKNLFFLHCAFGVNNEIKCEGIDVDVVAQKQKFENLALFQKGDPQLSVSFLNTYPKIDAFYKKWNLTSFKIAEKIDDFKNIFDNEQQFHSACTNACTRDDIYSPHPRRIAKDLVSYDPVIRFGEYFLAKNLGHIELKWDQKDFEDYKKDLKV